MTQQRTSLKSKVIVPVDDIETFKKTLQKLNKKAEAFGLEPIEVIGSKTVEYYTLMQSEDIKDRTLYSRHLIEVNDWMSSPDHPPPSHVTETKHFVLKYPIIKLGNWEVIGHLSSEAGDVLAMPLTRNPGDSQAILKYLDCPQGCDHCQTNRARTSTFILKEVGTNNLKQVGSSCLQDFTGIDPAAALFLAKMSEYFWGAEGERDSEFFSSPKPSGYATQSVIAATLFVMEQDNGAYVSHKVADETGKTATSAHVVDLLEGLLTDQALRAQWRERQSELMQTAEKILEWSASLPIDNLYNYNLSSLLKNRHIPAKPKFLGLAVSAAPAYRASLNRQQQAAASSHIGTKGESVEMVLTHHHTGSVHGRFGPTYFIGLRDQNGNALIWKTAKCLAELGETEKAGKPFIAKFKIKEHSEYKGMAQTEVSHLKFIGWQDKDLHTPDQADECAEDEYASMRMR